MVPLRRPLALPVILISTLLAVWPQAQGPTSASLTVLSREGRRALPTSGTGAQEQVALDDLAAIFGLVVREDPLAGGVTVSGGSAPIVMSADQSTVSAGGRIIALSSPVTRAGRRWMVPIDFLQRALAPAYAQRIEVRRASRLVIVGDLRVPRITARLESSATTTRVTLDITPATTVTPAADGQRVLLRVDADALDVTLPMPGGLVDQLRVPSETPTTIAVIASARAAPPRVTQSPGDGLTRVTIDVPVPGAPAETSTPAPVPPPAAAEPPGLSASSPRLQTIVLDPGHGGEDVGVRGAGGAQEKALTLEVARRLRALIEMRLGIRVILTREDDRMVGPDERAALANNSKADLFLSLHLNGAPVASVAGAQVFSLRLDEEGEKARRDATADTVALPVLSGATRQLEIVRWDLAQAAHVDASEMFAALVERALASRITMAAQPRQQAQLRVLVGANMPAALVEIGYLSNKEQEAQARSEAYQATVAQALFDAITEFRTRLEGQAAP